MWTLLNLTFGAFGNCPSDEVIQGNLTCSSTFYGTVDATEASHLGGECADGGCYTCGEPWSDQAQVAPEAVYTFHCQQSGSVLMEITDLPCDLDIYILDDTCDPNAGCVDGSTQSFNATDSVTFECTAGSTYYVVVEAYGTNHLDVASGPCTDDGTSTGNIISPTYTLSFDVSQSTGCAEDCDNGLDDDLDGEIDCSDDDCWTEPLCCDLDGDGNFALDCLGTDCDDTNPNVFTGAPEDGGNGTNNGDGVDNDCDGTVDEGTLDYDDDGDGLTETQGDCDDTNPNVNPNVNEILANGLDDDCDGFVDSNTSSYDDDGDGLSEEDGDCDDDNPTVSSQAEEIPNNGIDDDCDGEIDEEPAGQSENQNTVDGTENERSKGCRSVSSTPLSTVVWSTFTLLMLGLRRRSQ